MYLLGYDIGSSSVKASLVDSQSGKCVASAFYPKSEAPILAVCPEYAAPSNIRGTLLSWNQFAIIFGQLVVYFVNFLILGSNANPVVDQVDGAGRVLNPDAAAYKRIRVCQPSLAHPSPSVQFLILSGNMFPCVKLLGQFSHGSAVDGTFFKQHCQF